MLAAPDLALGARTCLSLDIATSRPSCTVSNGGSHSLRRQGGTRWGSFKSHLEGIQDGPRAARTMLRGTGALPLVVD